MSLNAASGSSPDERFVQDHQLGSVQQGADDGEFLLHAVRVGAHERAEVARDAEHLGVLFDARRPRAAFPTPNMSPMKFKYWMPVRNSYRSGLSGIYAVTALQATRLLFDRYPVDEDLALIEFEDARHRARSVVVLPAPFCPMKP